MTEYYVHMAFRDDLQRMEVMFWNPESNYYPFLRMINDGMLQFIRTPFQIVSFHKYYVQPKVDNPCGEIVLGKPQLCVLGTRGITSPYQMTTFWGIMYVIQEILPQESQYIAATG